MPPIDEADSRRAEPAGDPLDRRLIEILTRDREPAETIETSFRHKEEQVGQLFATLPSPEARALRERLHANHGDDVLAACFGRLASERRHRLLARLADTPRRTQLTSKGQP